MKKYIITAAASLLLCAGSAALWAHVSSDEFFDANAEALIASRESDGDGNLVNCYSESSINAGWTYYDCGSCKKTYGEKGEGAPSTCRSKDAG